MIYNDDFLRDNKSWHIPGASAKTAMLYILVLILTQITALLFSINVVVSEIVHFLNSRITQYVYKTAIKIERILRQPMMSLRFQYSPCKIYYPFQTVLSLVIRNKMKSHVVFRTANYISSRIKVSIYLAHQPTIWQYSIELLDFIVIHYNSSCRHYQVKAFCMNGACRVCYKFDLSRLEAYLVMLTQVIFPI